MAILESGLFIGNLSIRVHPYLQQYCRIMPYAVWIHSPCMTDLSRKRIRDNLTPRREPYWQRLAAGAYLGFRRGPNTWLARYRGRDKRKQFRALGEALEFDEAKRRAEDWLAQLTGSPVRAIKRGTVIAALETYLNDLRRHDRTSAAAKAEGQFKTALGFNPEDKRYTDILATLQLEQLTKDDVLDWRARRSTVCG